MQTPHFPLFSLPTLPAFQWKGATAFVQILSLFFLYFSVTAQTYIPETRLYGIKDGLSHRQVNALLEDRQGYIWAGTPLGLNRFDGYSFRTWGRENGLQSDQIEHLFEDAYGFIWVFHAEPARSIDLIDPRSNKVVSFAEQYGTLIPGGFQDKTGFPILTRDSTLYWAQTNGFITFHPKRGFRAVSLRAVMSNSLPTFTLDFVSAQKTVWGTIGKFEHKAIVEVDRNGKLLQLIDNKAGEIMYVRPGRSAEGAVNHYNVTNRDKWKSVCLRIDPSNKTEFIPSSALLPGYDYGYYLTTYAVLSDPQLRFSDYRIFDQARQRLLFNFNQFYSGVEGRARSFLIDRSGTIWLGTDLGLMLLRVQENRFQRFLHNPDEKGLKNICRGILVNDQQMLVSTTQAVFTGDRTTSQFQAFPGTVQQNPSAPPLFWYALTSDGAGRVFAGETGSLNQLLLKPGRMRQLFKGPIFMPWMVLPDRQNRLWIGTYRDGLYVAELGRQQVLPFAQYNRFKELQTAGIPFIQPDREGRIWLCASTGFYRLNFQKGILERHWSGGQGNSYLPFDNFTHFYEDSDGIFWLATNGGGLISWNSKTGKTRQFSRKAGLPNNTIYAVYEDAHHHLWLPSDYGIIQFDKMRGNVRRVFLPEDGITDAEFSLTSHYRSTDSTLFFGSLNGVTAFQPNDFYEQKETGRAPLVITGFQQFDGNSNQLVDKTAELLASHEIILQPDDRFFNLEFALLTFNQSGKIQYAYKIDGVDADWTYQNEPRLRVNRLPYGSHVLNIKGQEANGLWGRNDLTIKLTVVRPFYLQFWFLAGCFLGMILLIRFWFGWRTRDLQKNQLLLVKEVNRQTNQIREQTEKLQQLDTFKTRFYTNITHEFRTPLTVIMGMASEIGESVHDPSSPVIKAVNLIRRNSKNLLRLINQLLDLAKLDAGSMQIQLVQADIIGYLHYLTESFYSLAQEKQIRLLFYPETPELVMDFDEEKWQIIVYNLLSNALKFTGESGKVVLHVVEKEENTRRFLQMKVQDTGMGIAPEELSYIFDRFYQADHLNSRKGDGTGIGLALTKELVELMDGQIAVESSVGKGTVITVRLPVRREPIQQASLHPVSRTQTPEFSTDAPAAEADLTSEVTDSEKPLLLLIEDNADVIAYITGLLRTTYQIETARDGKAGIIRAFETVPDLIISDVMMPEADGYEVCQTLKNDERSSHIPLILLTAKATQEDKVAGLRLGADAYLPKPFDKAELFVLMEKLIGLRKVLQKHYSKSGILGTLPPAANAAVRPLDSIFLQKIREAIEARLDDPELGILHLCQAVNLSHTQVFRKLKALTGENPTLFIRKMRLQKALQLLQSTELNISEIAYTVGFSDPNYFSRVFHEEFGKAPSSVRH
ncbi:hybrid sensor histidine kinase/response regulator transcription factor [Larkinella rosea]|uniref:histidine kinase n=1 Tax=Larkinella rosea TaxID=2025312 RepID=A0A3P1C1N8_9BACT|nr:hybrid sensor histidine kinase/response regulator transcription factor [Larkinella rosea]RRB07305.1 hybrid sensor histidine kinase/response regulator [Larkinella rosea]